LLRLAEEGRAASPPPAQNDADITAQLDLLLDGPWSGAAAFVAGQILNHLEFQLRAAPRCSPPQPPDFSLRLVSHFGRAARFLADGSEREELQRTVTRRLEGAVAVAFSGGRSPSEEEKDPPWQDEIDEVRRLVESGLDDRGRQLLSFGILVDRGLRPTRGSGQSGAALRDERWFDEVIQRWRELGGAEHQLTREFYHSRYLCMLFGEPSVGPEVLVGQLVDFVMTSSLPTAPALGAEEGLPIDPTAPCGPGADGTARPVEDRAPAPETVVTISFGEKSYSLQRDARQPCPIPTRSGFRGIFSLFVEKVRTGSPLEVVRWNELHAATRWPRSLSVTSSARLRKLLQRVNDDLVNSLGRPPSGEKWLVTVDGQGMQLSPDVRWVLAEKARKLLGGTSGSERPVDPAILAEAEAGPGTKHRGSRASTPSRSYEDD
jgi:hypothetical protein